MVKRARDRATNRPSDQVTMRLPRFFVSPEILHGEHVTLTETVAHQIRQVLRLRVGERVVLLDNAGSEYETLLERVDRYEVTARVTERRAVTTEPTRTSRSIPHC